MNFIEKLIQETKSGKFDFIWQYVGSSYKFDFPKHPMSRMNFVLVNNKKSNVELMVFPNGGGINFDKSSMQLLASEIDRAILRANDVIVSDYISGAIEKQVAEVDKKDEKIKKETKVKKEVKVKKETEVDKTT